MVEEWLREEAEEIKDVRGCSNTSALLGPARLKCAEAESLEWHACHPTK